MYVCVYEFVCIVRAMEVDETGSKPIGGRIEEDRLRVKRKTLEAVLEQCQRALELLSTTDTGECSDGEAEDGNDEAAEGLWSGPCGDKETEELCDLLKSRVDCPDFLEKLESAQASVSQNKAEEGSSSWDMINDNDLWEGGNTEPDQEDYVLVRQEDIVEGIACFMATYLLSLKQTKVGLHSPFDLVRVQLLCPFSSDLTPNQLQDALSKTFSVKKKQGKLRKAWDGSKVIYNVVSWGATAIGIYQNPALLRAASAAFWTSCHVISKLF
ncbi:Inactive serine/threonine-protein kinase roco10 [Actinidia chinensis var. chinensis]|uniref:Inactive serine/threonine-protein kinase roco10 n=1 Tax=Actinidia chinensis var. chinensis TaxID=1590841 RepID=A0A2R6RNH8_ACTCC|nr:Inactive serine/threonine-protein kinase roco10 [Actinidia chinensis var. chinensis]